MATHKILSSNGAFMKYLNNLATHAKTTKRIGSDGLEYAYYKGAWIPLEQFNQLFPVTGILDKSRDKRIDSRQHLLYS